MKKADGASVFQREFLGSSWHGKSPSMWLRRVDGCYLSSGSPALSAHLHLLPTPVKTTTKYELNNINKYMYLQRIVPTSTGSSVASVSATLTTDHEVSASLSHCLVVIWCFRNVKKRNWMSSPLLWVLFMNFPLVSNISFLVESVDYSKSSWYVRCGHDLLSSCYSIKDNSDLLRVFAKTLHIAEVAVSDLLPSLTLLPLRHVQKPSTTNHQTEQGWSVRSSGSVNLFRLVLEKWALFALFIFWSLLLNKDKGKGVISYSKLVSTVVFHWAITINWMNKLSESSFPWPWESFWAMTGPVPWILPPR